VRARSTLVQRPLTGQWSGRDGHLRGIGDPAVVCCLHSGPGRAALSRACVEVSDRVSRECDVSCDEMTQRGPPLALAMVCRSALHADGA
jgi:hypothetical protein